MECFFSAVRGIVFTLWWGSLFRSVLLVVVVPFCPLSSDIFVRLSSTGPGGMLSKPVVAFFFSLLLKLALSGARKRCLVILLVFTAGVFFVVVEANLRILLTRLAANESPKPYIVMCWNRNW